MALVLQLTPLVNLLSSTIIVITGLIVYGKTRRDLPLYVAGAFLLFGLTHFATLLGAGDAIMVPLTAIRVTGYALIVGMLYLCYANGKEE